MGQASLVSYRHLPLVGPIMVIKAILPFGSWVTTFAIVRELKRELVRQELLLQASLILLLQLGQSHSEPIVSKATYSLPHEVGNTGRDLASWIPLLGVFSFWVDPPHFQCYFPIDHSCRLLYGYDNSQVQRQDRQCQYNKSLPSPDTNEAYP